MDGIPHEEFGVCMMRNNIVFRGEVFHEGVLVENIHIMVVV